MFSCSPTSAAPLLLSALYASLYVDQGSTVADLQGVAGLQSRDVEGVSLFKRYPYPAMR